MVYYNYQNVPAITVNLTVYRGKTKVKEDFSNAQLFVWLISKHNKIPLSVTVDSGVITCTMPTDLDMGVYGLKAIWTKADGEYTPSQQVPYGMEIHADKTCRVDVDNVFCIINDTVGTTTDGEINISADVATYGYDGLDAYELAVINGYTKLTKEEWLASRSLTAVLQDEGTNTDAGMSQAAITEALDKIRSVLGSAYKLCGAVDTLPTTANVGDVYLINSTKVSWGCYGAYDEDVYSDFTWRSHSADVTSYVKDTLDSFVVDTPKLMDLIGRGTASYYILKYQGSNYFVFPCGSDGTINGSPICYSNGFVEYSESVADYVLSGTRSITHAKGTAKWVSLGVLSNIDYTPEAEATQYTPESDSMLSGKTNVQAALDVCGIKTPSLELNLVTGANYNAEIINANFAALVIFSGKLLNILQQLVDKVEFASADGFNDVSDMIDALSLDYISNVNRVTSGGSLSETTAMAGSALAGSAISGTI